MLSLSFVNNIQNTPESTGLSILVIEQLRNLKILDL